MSKTLISFSGAAGTYPIQFGVARRIRELSTLYPQPEVCYAGVSAGCLPALSLALGLDETDVLRGYDFFLNLFRPWWKSKYTHFYKNTGKLIKHYLPENAYETLENTYHVSITTVGMFGIRNEIISKFHSNQDLCDAILTSMHIPFLFARPPVTIFRDSLAMDGGITNNLIKFSDTHNICLAATDHKVNFLDWSVSICPKKWDRLYDQGYKDALTWPDLEAKFKVKCP